MDFFLFVRRFQNVPPFYGGKWSTVAHMPKAVKYSSQNQSGLFFPLDYDQVAGKERIQEHRECPTVHSKNEKKKKKELGRKSLESNDL